MANSRWPWPFPWLIQGSRGLRDKCVHMAFREASSQHKIIVLISPFATSDFSIHYLMVRNILKQEQKFKSQNDTFEKLRTILKHDAKVKDQNGN